MRPTFKEQFDKLTSAYIAGKVNPMSHCACFIGNLLDNDASWSVYRNYRRGGNSECSILSFHGGYNIEDIVAMENNFLRVLTAEGRIDDTIIHLTFTPSSRYIDECFACHNVATWRAGNQSLIQVIEDRLFLAFESTLAMLKQIHERDGEVVDAVPVFVKRQLAGHATA